MKTASPRVLSLLTALLLAALSLLFLPSCGLVTEIENNSDSNFTQQTEPESPTSEPTVSVSDTQDSGNPESPTIPDPFEGVSFGGAEVLLTIPLIAKNEFSVESSGTALSEAVVLRNRSVEKRIRIQLIENIPAGAQSRNDYGEYLQQAVLSGTELGIAVIPSELSRLAVSGLFRNLAGTPVNLQNPWFDASFLSAEDIGGYIPFAVGDMTPSAWENAPAVLVRADLASGLLNLPNLYQVVRNQQWTLEFLQELVALLNAGTELDALAVSKISQASTLFGASIRLIQRQQDGTPAFTMLDERTVSACNALSELFRVEQEKPVLQEPADAQQGFCAGRTVLLIERLGSAQELAKADPTLKLVYLPLPKSDSRQTGYLTTPTNYSMLSIPTSSRQNPLLAATAIEALGYDSTLTLPLGFLQTYLTQYGTGTSEAAEMLSYLLTGITFAPEIIWSAPLDYPWYRMVACLSEPGAQVLPSYMSRLALYTEHLHQLMEQLSRYRNA